MHAGGVLIAPGELTDFCPLYKAPGSEGEDGIISMFDKDDIEELGLVKFDFLGLRNLTILDVALKELNRMKPERHITLDRSMYGSDQAASIEPAGLTHLIGAVRKIEQAMGDGIKRPIKEEESIAKNLRQHLNWKDN